MPFQRPSVFFINLNLIAMKTFLRKITGLFALALMLTPIAGSAYAQVNENEANWGTYVNRDYQFKINFPINAYIDTGSKDTRGENPNENPFFAFDTNEGQLSGLYISPEGGIDLFKNVNLSLLESSEVVINERNALKEVFETDSNVFEEGTTLIRITFTKNPPENWKEGGTVDLFGTEEQMKVYNQMLDSLTFF